MWALTPRTIFHGSEAARGAVVSTLDVTQKQMCWFLLVLAVVFSAAVRWLRARTPGGLKPFFDLPAPPQTFFLGNLFDLTKGERLQFHLVFHRWAQTLGPIYRYNILGDWKIVVTDPALLPKILGRPGLPKSRTYKAFRQLCSWNEEIMFTRLDPHDPHWQNPRKTLARAFSAGEIRKKFDATVDATLQLAAKLDTLAPGTAVEAQDAMRRVTMDVTLTAGFGLPSVAVQQFGRPVPVLDAMHYAYAVSSKRVCNPVFAFYERWLPFLPAARENRRRHVELYSMYDDMLTQLEAKGPVAADDNSMWGCLKRIEDPDTGRPLTRAQLRPEMADMFLGAVNTTSQTCAITLGLVAGHPEVQRRIADELDSRGLLATAANPTPRRPRHEDLARLPYLDAVLRESFRVLPVSAVGMQRVTSAPVTDLGGYAVPANTEVLVSIYGLHHSSKYWDAPETFLPERWLEPACASSEKQSFSGASENARHDTINLSASAADTAAPATLTCSMSMAGPANLNRSMICAETASTKWTSAAGVSEDGRKAAFLPFSGGPIDCVGQRLAMMMAPLMLAILLSRFEVELDEGMGGVEGMLARQCNTFSISIDQGLHMKFEPRVKPRAEPAAPQEPIAMVQ